MIHCLSIHEAALLLRKNQATLIDVREGYEYMHEHIPFALSLPLSECDRWLPWVAEHTPTIWIIHCLKQTRSEKFATMLSKVLPPDCEHRIYVLEGGLDRWAHAGFETVKGSHPKSNVDDCFSTCNVPCNAPCHCAQSACCTTCCNESCTDTNRGMCKVPPSYKDPTQRKMNVIIGALVLGSTYCMKNLSYTFAETLLWIIGIGLILNGIFAWCFLYRALSVLCCKKTSGQKCGEKCTTSEGSCTHTR